MECKMVYHSKRDTECYQPNKSMDTLILPTGKKSVPDGLEEINGANSTSLIISLEAKLSNRSGLHGNPKNSDIVPDVYTLRKTRKWTV